MTTEPPEPPYDADWPPDMQLAARERVRAADPVLFDAVSALLYQHDPAGISYDGQPDEYDAEAGTIIPRLPDAHTAADVGRIVEAELTRWFGRQQRSAGYRPQALARTLWALWRSHAGPP